MSGEILRWTPLRMRKSENERKEIKNDPAQNEEKPK